MLESRYPSPRQLAVIGIVFLACLIGALIPVYVGFIGENYARLMALPALILLTFLLVFDRTALFFLLIMVRVGADAWFAASKIPLGGYETGVGGLLNAFMILIALLLVVEREKAGEVSRMVLPMWAAFLFAMLYGLVMSPVKAEAVRTFLQMTSNFAIFVGAFCIVRSAEDFKTCVRVVLWSSVVPAAYGFLELAAFGVARSDGFRLFSTLSHPNVFAFYLTVVISLLLYTLKSSSYALSTQQRVWLTTYLFALLLLLLMTKTRSAWAACFLLFAMYAVIFQRRYLLYLILLPLLALLIPGVGDRLLVDVSSDVAWRGREFNSFAWRRLMWESSLQWMQPENYFLGYGLGALKHYSPIFFPLARGVENPAHNVYVQCFFELGVVGLIAYLWLFGQLLQRLRSLVTKDKLGAFLVIGLTIEYLVVSLSDNIIDYVVFNWYYWFVVGAGCGLAAAASQSRANSE